MSSVVFDRAADYYDQTRGFPPGIDQQVGEFIAREALLSTDTRVLEIGVGTGRIALPLAKQVGSLVGVDLSPLMLERLRQKKVDERVEVVQGDVMHLPLPSQSFDAALMVHILHLVADPKRAVEELARVLKPAGKALQCWNDRDDTYFAPITRAWESVAGSRQGAWRAGKSSLTEMGWQQVGDEHVYRYTTPVSPQEMADNYRNRVWSGLWNVPDEVWQRGVEAVEAALKAHYPNPEQKHDVPSSFHLRIFNFSD
jgi:ubiquinone/menaquinone biosynthesis C-methylase UbiE